MSALERKKRKHRLLHPSGPNLTQDTIRLLELSSIPPCLRGGLVAGSRAGRWGRALSSQQFSERGNRLDGKWGSVASTFM